MKFNPALQPANERISAKIWELLRRNNPFREDAKRFSEYHQTLTSSGETDSEEQITANSAGWEMVNKPEQKNVFAATALVWMYPIPMFEDDLDKLNWGPIILRSTGDKIDTVKEWQVYENLKDKLTVETSWKSAPNGFKRAFISHYSKLDSRIVNPITKKRWDTTHPHETDFFEGWDLGDLIHSPNLIDEFPDKILRFSELRDDYRVLAVPRWLHTRKAVDDALKELEILLKKDLKTKSSELGGTVSEWTDFLAVEEIRERKKLQDQTEAIHLLIKERIPGPDKRAAHRSIISRVTFNVRVINQQIEEIYP